jgi:hypothetical protein
MAGEATGAARVALAHDLGHVVVLAADHEAGVAGRRQTALLHKVK